MASPRNTAFNRLQFTVGGVSFRPTRIYKSLVPPAESTKPQDEWLALSNLDRVVTPAFSSAIHFYENAVNGSRGLETISSDLKQSLAKVLIHFFPLAGRLRLRKDGLIDIHCNDEGAVFVEATLKETLADLGGPQPMDAMSGLEVARLGRGPLYIPDQLTSIPTLVVQVTHFKCGAIAIGTNWHHSVADGLSGCHFIKSWCELAMGKELSLVPNHNRMILNPRRFTNSSLVRDYSSTAPYNLQSVSEVYMNVMQTCSGSKELEPPVLGMFNLDKITVQELKDVVNLESEAAVDGVRNKFTSAESISGTLWRRMTKARSAELEGGNHNLIQQTVTRFFMFVDGRKTLNMPAGYFGNVVCSACAVTTEEELLQKPPAYAVGLVCKARATITADYFKSLIDWVEEQGKVPSKSEHLNSVGRDVAATLWTFFPLYEMDFGFGKPVFAIRNSPPNPLIDGIAMMPSPQGPGHMVALLNLHNDRMRVLRGDPQFNLVFSST